MPSRTPRLRGLPTWPAENAEPKSANSPTSTTICWPTKTSPGRRVFFESGYDAKKIQGWIVTPPEFDKNQKYPLILEIHGGPYANYGSRFAAELQLYAAAGYVVVYINPRGSTGYGQAFSRLIHHGLPGA